MARGLVLLAALLLAGCGDRRDFDQRYQDTGSALANEAQQLDANLADDNLPAADENAAKSER